MNYKINDNGYFVVKIEENDSKDSKDSKENQKYIPERLSVSDYNISSVRKHKNHYDVSLENITGDLYYNGMYMLVSYIFMKCKDSSFKQIQKICIVTESGSIFEYEYPNYIFTFLHV